MLVFRLFIAALLTTVLTPHVWAYNYGQSALSLQRYLDANPNQLPLIEQLSVRVHSQPIPMAASQPDTQKIAVVLRGSADLPSNQAWVVAFKRRMQELNIDFRLDVFHAERDDGIYATLHTFKKIEAANFDYLIVDGVDDYNRPLLERILKRDEIAVVVLNAIAPFSAWRLHPPLIYIGIDSAKMMQRLASYLHRVLPERAMIDVISTQDAYLNQRYCQIFENEQSSLGHKVRFSYQVSDQAAPAYSAAQAVLERGMDTLMAHFIFSCTPNIAQGVARAISERGASTATTNAWLGQKSIGQASQEGVVMVTVLEMKDNMAIATAEAIKGDIESRLLPRIYMESFHMLTPEMDEQTRQLTFQQAVPYSSSLWPR
ncbi:Autoinducer 2-binding periplasmic protein LuxP precursor [Marinomonas aquimarina]|uniref:Autoinducer 2-binding periplasmic protein LuxP n=1 Tax=Marinomonas aquimarina TaxID=295068 RepID=A0A1A8TSA8_9GAMM|nr:hypothetical protein [Marinomonas aquimarina]SBS36188.1 Autoinducer 2-binding periplasmic protein LuxP precursor [Marinomonas aquimarina]